MIIQGWRIVKVVFPYIGAVMIGFKGDTIRIRKGDDPFFKAAEHTISEDKKDVINILKE